MAKINKRHIQILKHGAIYFTALLTLFLIGYRNFTISEREYIESLSAKSIINTEIVAPEVLYTKTLDLIKKNYFDKNLNGQSITEWKNRYKNKIKTSDDTYLALNTMLASLDDPYSKFLSKSEFKVQTDNIDSKAKGIGINIASYSGKIYIANVLKNTPADFAGLKRGDLILKIDDFNIKGKSLFQAIQHLKGPVGTNVVITVLRGEKELTKKIKREEININNVEYKKLDKNIGYIRLSSFISKDTPKYLIGALENLKDTKGLVLDLRGNKGGLFQNAIFSANLFLQNGYIVHVLDNKGNLNSYSADKNTCVYFAPLIILADNESASAAEILAGALKDNKRAKIVGTKTFGKGLVQKVYPLPNETGINLTVGRYITPSGKSINKKGIKPDFKVYLTKEDLESGIDSQLIFAMNLLQNGI